MIWGVVTTPGNPDGDLATEVARRVGRAGADLVLIAPTPGRETAFLAGFMTGTVDVAVIGGARSADVPPYTVARQVNALDHLSGGRGGWWCTDTAENPPRIAEHLQVLRGLWSSWDADAVVMDRVSGAYADHTKVRPLEHVGAHYKVRGPLNTVPSPQFQPVVVLEGSTPEVVEVATRLADVLLVPPGPVPVTDARALVRMPATVDPADLLAAVADADGFVLDLPAEDVATTEALLAHLTTRLLPALAAHFTPKPRGATLRHRLSLED